MVNDKKETINLVTLLYHQAYPRKKSDFETSKKRLEQEFLENRHEFCG
mgnify:CR=1 FL=1